MSENKLTNSDVVVVGGGLAGLTTAAYLARAGQTVTVLEQAHQFGGRATTQVKNGFYFNLGPHALYRGAAAARVFKELGVTYCGAMPDVTGLVVKAGRTHLLPGNPLTMLATRVVGVRAKFELARLLTTIPKIDSRTLAHLTVRQWLETTFRWPEARAFLEALFRVSTYTNAPDHLSAEVAVSQLQLSLANNVEYLDDGWQTLVDGVQKIAETAGVKTITGSRVKSIDRDEWTGTYTVRLANDQTIEAPTVVIAASPDVARSLVQGGQNAVLRRWADSAIPVKAACLDVALKTLPQPRTKFAVGVDKPLYLSVHSAVARLAPDGSDVIHVAKYLDHDEPADPERDRRELEQLLDLIQPGWRAELIEVRFLPHMTVINDLVTAQRGGYQGRPGPAVPGLNHLYVVGDWVGGEGLLLNASLASARQAAHLIIEAAQAQKDPQPIAIELAVPAAVN